MEVQKKTMESFYRTEPTINTRVTEKSQGKVLTDMFANTDKPCPEL